MTRHIALTAAALLVSGAAALAGGHVVPLEFFEHADLEEGVTPYGSAFLQLQKNTPPGEWKLPELTGDGSLYGLAELGDSEFLLVVDAGEGGDSAFERVFFDANGNRDLTDDDPVSGERMEFDDGYFVVMFEDPLHVDYEIGGERFPYALSFQISGMDPDKFEMPEGVELPEGFEMPSSVNLILMTGCCYAGEFELAGEKFQARFGDSNCDGRFDERVSIPDDENMVYAGGQIYPQGDHLYLTDGKELTYEDQLSLGNHLLVGGQLYAVAVDILAKKLTLSEVTEGLLPLKLSCAPQRMVAHSKDFKSSIMMIDPGDVVKLPGGEYRMLTYTMLGKGEDGDVWRIAGGATEDSPFVDLNGSGEALMTFGEPFTASAEVSEWAREMLAEADGEEKPEVYIEFSIRGAAQEAISDLSLVSGKPVSVAMSAKDRKRPAEPTYTIVKDDGELLKKGSFEYG